MKTFKIITFGCRVNQAESRLIGEKIVKLLNCQIVKKNKKADFVVINTCCVTNKAEREVRKEIRRVKRENPDCFLVVCGCFVENKKKKNLEPSSRLFSLVDLWLGNEEKEKIGEILEKKFTIIDPRSLPNYGKFHDKYARSKKALVKIQDGCDNFCTYCIVPYVRGRSKSRSAKQIIKEINSLVEKGIEEVVLTGIDIADYKFSARGRSSFGRKNHLVQLIKLVLAETEIRKISFGSMGIRIFDDEFIRLYNENNLRSTASKFFSSGKMLERTQFLNIVKGETLSTKKKNLEPSYRLFSDNVTMKEYNNRLSSHFHIPLQSGCDAVLKRMKRNYTAEEFIKTIERLKKHISNFSFSTDIIVGFPGETKEEFKDTVRVIREIGGILGKKFKKIHVFRYSAKKGTLAAKKEAQKDWEKVDEREKKNRAKVLQFLMTNF